MTTASRLKAIAGKDKSTTRRPLYRSRRLWFILATVVTVGISVAACTGSPPSAQDNAIAASDALQKDVYQQQNNIEFHNYNRRQQVADDPTTILWCTAYFANPNVKPITVPIVGKLTSSKKRPYPTSRVEYGTSGNYNPEIPAPDHLFGDSTEYRYGFTPGGVYFDFTDVATVCTTQPTTYQATSTEVVLKVDPGLNAAAQAAQAAMKAGQTGQTVSPDAGAQAQQILEQATNGG